MRKIFSLDRFEGDFAVCVSDDEEQIDVPRAELEGFSRHDIFSAEICEGRLCNVMAMPEERDRRLRENRERLTALFNRKKKK